MPERAKPVLAVIARNTLAAMGLAALIEEVMPIAETRIYSSLSEVSAEMRHRCFHFFISISMTPELNMTSLGSSSIFFRYCLLNASLRAAIVLPCRFRFHKSYKLSLIIISQSR